MQTMEVIRSRKSVRRYTGKPATSEQLETVLAAAQASPIAMAAYDKMHLTVVSDPQVLAEIDAAGVAFFNRPTMTTTLYGAPMLIVVSTIVEPGRENSMFSSAAIVVHNMSLAATELGVGSCDIWGAINATRDIPSLVEKLQLPEGFTPCCAMTLGQTDETFADRTLPTDRIAVNLIG